MAAQLRPTEAHREVAEDRPRNLGRWIIPVGGGLVAAVLIVVATPHVAWYVRALLAMIAFVYIAGQSAAYLWSSHEQG